VRRPRSCAFSREVLSTLEGPRVAHRLWLRDAPHLASRRMRAFRGVPRACPCPRPRVGPRGARRTRGLGRGCLSPAAARAIRVVPRLNGGVEVIERIDALLAAAGVTPEARGTTELARLVGATSTTSSRRVRVLLRLLDHHSFDYYTASSSRDTRRGRIAASLASGGRYDAVLKEPSGVRMWRPVAFAISLERLQGDPRRCRGESGVVHPWGSSGRAAAAHRRGPGIAAQGHHSRARGGGPAVQSVCATPVASSSSRRTASST